MPTILGIESSCDETAASIVRGDVATVQGEILSNIVYSQIDDHKAFGGVVPEIAARAHVEKMDIIIRSCLSKADVGWNDIDAIAATTGPGLIGGLIVGAITGKSIAYAKQKPFLPINHLEGHALTARLTNGTAFPYLMLLVSGGHTQIVLVKALGHYERWATTIDDALGEAFDKTAKLLGLPYPGGPVVEKLAHKGDPHRFTLPHPLKGKDTPDFSFSGLKTALRRQASQLAPLSEQDVCDLCASFQAAVVRSIESQVKLSLLRYRNEILDGPATLVVAGGVAANNDIRAVLSRLCGEFDFTFYAPPHELCTDNAAMIAWAGLEHFSAGVSSNMEAMPRPRWPLDAFSDPVLGSGKKGAKV